MPSTRIARQFDFSGGIQNSTSRLLRRENEVVEAKNTSFSDFIGAVGRRKGYAQFSSTLQADKDGSGLFVHRYSTGSRLYAAVNNSGDTDTSVKYYDGSGWTQLFVTGAAGTRLNAISFLDEAYVVGATAGGTFMTTRNIDSTPASSTSRNLYTAPNAKFIAEFQGALYMMNVEVSGTKYTDRIYKSSVAQGVITFIKQLQVTAQGAATAIRTDTVRYLKAGMAVDIYRAGTETKLYDITITSVDKAADTFTYTAPAIDFTNAQVNTATDEATVDFDLVTGTALQITTVGTMPTGLTASTTYYAIRQSATVIKFATSYKNALAGTAIDITAAGAGTFAVNVVFEDNDEIWGDGRKGKLSVYWNTDYPNPEGSDYLRVPPGLDEDNAITGYITTQNRMFVFTKNSMLKWDGQNFIPVSETIGCLQHECIKSVGAWIIFPHSTGVWAYNEANGQLKLISRGIRNIWQSIPLANFAKASAGADNNIYKLSVGAISAIDNKAQVGNLRLVYDFDMNVWSTEWHTRNQRFHAIWTVSNVRDTYFQDDTGKVFKDATGYVDDTATIPYDWDTGPNNFALDEEKNYVTAYVYCRQARGVQVFYSIDGGPPQFLGQCDKYIERFVFNRNSNGRDISYSFVHNAEGEGPIVEGIATHYSLMEAAYAAG